MLFMLFIKTLVMQNPCAASRLKLRSNWRHSNIEISYPENVIAIVS